MRVEAVILTALAKEYQAVLAALRRHGEPESYRGGRGTYLVYLVRGMRVAVPGPTGAGVTSAALGAGDATADLSAKLVLLSGIAGCMRNRPTSGEPQCELGDVVVADTVIDYTMDKDKDEVVEDKSGGRVRARRYEPRKVEFPLCNAVKSAVLRRHVGVSGWHPDRQADRDWHAQVEVPPPPPRQANGPGAPPDRHPGLPAVHVGKVLSGNSVLASGEGKAELLGQIDKPAPLAVEMEAAGVARALHRLNGSRPEFAAVKSLCDWADGDKDDDWHAYCAHVAALYCVHIIECEAGGLLGRQEADREQPQRELRERTREASERFFRSVGVSDAFLEAAATAVQNSAVTEVIDLTGGEYKSDLSTSNQYLIRARPFFESAARIYATSLDTVSTFWTTPGTREDARAYIRAQGGPAGIAARLFVFTTPESAHRHARVLDENCRAYGNVYVCSADHYASLLRDRVAPRQAEAYMARDFAVLDYPDGRSYLAEFDGRNLRLDPVDPDSEFIDCEATRALFRDLERLPPGGFDEGLGVLRWDAGYWQLSGGEDSPPRARGAWAAVLKKMFEERKADVFHTVAFDIEDSEYRDLREMLAQIKYQILDSRGRGQSLSARYNIKQIWLTKRHPYCPATAPRDGLTRGRIHMSASRSRKYMLIMQFASVPGLMGYYADTEHSALRMQLYSMIDQTLRSLFFNRGGRPDAVEDPAGRAEQYELVEALAAHKLHRLDFVDDELIEHMVQSRPYDL